MRRLLAHRTGEPEDVLAIADVPDDPAPGPGEVTIAVHAAGLNFLDVMLCRGTYPLQPEPPVTPGVELAGRVLAAGAGAERLIGLDVLACPTLPRGALGDTVTVDADLTVIRPAGLGAVDAAALPVIYQTAWFALGRAGVTAGDTVLIHAGAGGVGVAATQLAVARGARVICTAGDDVKTALCRDHGADLAVNYRTGDFVAAVHDATGGVGVDVVLDPVGGEVFARSLECLAFEGRVVAIGAAGGPPPAVDPMRLVAGNVGVIGVSWGSAYPWRRPAAVREAYQKIFELYAAGAVRPPVSRVVPLAGAPGALADLAARRTVGKVVVTTMEGGVHGHQ
jgi:NADPH2:quinone reductase